MFETGLAQLRFAGSILFGWELDEIALERLIDGVLATYHEFGEPGPAGREITGGPPLDGEARRDLQLRRFRAQAKRAAAETAYYKPVFQQLGLDPGRLTWDDISAIPPTSKDAARDRPAEFWRAGLSPAFRTATTGTTGHPTSTYFTAKEIRTTVALNALTFLLQGTILPHDVVQISTSSRATLGNSCFSRSCERLGAVWYQAGLVAPEIGLQLLAESLGLAGKADKASYVNTYASYLGMLVEHGLGAGLGPADFGLGTVSVGGEVVTNGLKRRAEALFGPVRWSEGFGMTEIWPLGAQSCDEGHLHWEAIQGLVEVLDPDGLQPTVPGELGVLVATPFGPWRQGSVLLRYNTQDLVRPLNGPLTCSLQNVPATGPLEGKLRLAVRHEGGWTTPRQVMEALEALEAVPLPARFHFSAASGGVAVAVVARTGSADLRRAIGEALEAQGVPLAALQIHTDPTMLGRAYPLRGDLREASFA